MSFYLEETCNIPFDFAYAKLAEDVIAFCLSHENFPYEAEVNLTLTDNEDCLLYTSPSPRDTR